MSAREVVAVFNNEQSLEMAVYALEMRGFDRSAFSLLASEQAVLEKLGHRYQFVKEMEDEARAPRNTFFSSISRLEAEYFPVPLLASIGALAFFGVGPGILVLAATGTGAALGAVLGRIMHEHHAKRTQEQLTRGGLLLWTNVRNPSEELTALALLRRYGGADVHVHELKFE